MKHYFELGIIVDEGAWDSEQSFIVDFQDFLITKGMKGEEIKSKNSLVIEVTGQDRGLAVAPTPATQTEEASHNQIQSDELIRILNSLTKKKSLKVFKDTIS